MNARRIIWMLVHDGNLLLQLLTIDPVIITIDRRHVLSARFAEGPYEAVHAGISIAKDQSYPLGVVFGVLLQHFLSAIRGGIVDYDDFEIEIGLLHQYAVYCLADEG